MGSPCRRVFVFYVRGAEISRFIYCWPSLRLGGDARYLCFVRVRFFRSLFVWPSWKEGPLKISWG